MTLTKNLKTEFLTVWCGDTLDFVEGQWMWGTAWTVMWNWLSGQLSFCCCLLDASVFGACCDSVHNCAVASKFTLTSLLEMLPLGCWRETLFPLRQPSFVSLLLLWIIRKVTGFKDLVSLFGYITNSAQDNQLLLSFTIIVHECEKH